MLSADKLNEEFFFSLSMRRKKSRKNHFLTKITIYIEMDKFFSELGKELLQNIILSAFE